MPSDKDVVIDALVAALQHKPDDVSLLLHIAELLEAEGRSKEGLSYYQQILGQSPIHPTALKGAANCAKMEGKSDLSDGYFRMYNSLASESENTETVPSNVLSVVESDKPVAKKETVKRVRGAELRLVSDDDNADSWLDIEDSTIYLDDVGGMDDVKRRLNLAFLGPLKNPELMKAYGKSLSGGLLLYGPPGCGKTYIARALAGELGAKFISVGLTDILDMYVGESERKLHEIFESARRNSPAVLFFDELDAIGQKRSQLKNTGIRSLVNQLLSEMDSVNSENSDLFILGATNHPWDVDSALRRPGRFDRIVAVFPPDQVARKSILDFYLKDKPKDRIDTSQLAGQTNLYSGADLRYLCDSAAEYALEQSMATGKVQPITAQSFNKSLKEVKPSTKSWFETARNFALFANESGAYDDLLEYIRAHKL